MDTKALSSYFSCFISYGHPDEQIAIKINEFLKRNGIKTWAHYEQSKIGEWRPAIQQGLDEHECILLLVSRSALERTGVQDENRLALTDEIRPYVKRLLPVLIDDFTSLKRNVTSPEGRELLGFVKRVHYLTMDSGGKPRMTGQFKQNVLKMLRRKAARVLVIGATSVGPSEENEKFRPLVKEVARRVGKYLALHNAKPICMVTRGGGVDYLVCEGFRASSTTKDALDRLWLYPQARDDILYHGPGSLVSMEGLPYFEGDEAIDVLDRRSRFLVARMTADADCVIALRGGRGVEYACVICHGERKKLVLAPCLGGMGKSIYEQYSDLQNVVAPELCCRDVSADADIEHVADEIAKLLVFSAISMQ